MVRYRVSYTHFRDSITQFSAAHGFGKIDKFLVAGASKRGWTTWLTPAVDERIVAIVPIVMPMLNMGTLQVGVPY